MSEQTIREQIEARIIGRMEDHRRLSAILASGNTLITCDYDLTVTGAAENAKLEVEYLQKALAALSASGAGVDRPQDGDKDMWLACHVDRGHGITKAQQYYECTCGATYWSKELPGAGVGVPPPQESNE